MELTRDLVVEVVPNIRHLGGYRTRDGRETTCTPLVRSASLHRLSAGGIAALADSGVKTVVDLRSGMERERDVTPDLAPFGIVTVHAPVFESDASPVGQDPRDFPGYAVVYERMLASGQPAYRRLFETVAEAEGGVLFHCAVGKDRTGVGAALMLSVAGVSEADVIADYERSEGLLAHLFAEMLPRMQERGIDEALGRRLMAAPAADMAAMLAHIDRTWGSAEGYLLDIGVSTGALSAVRARLVG